MGLILLENISFYSCAGQGPVVFSVHRLTHGGQGATPENMKIINYIQDDCPDYALCYFVNADASGMEQADIDAADAWHDRCRASLAATHPDARIDLMFSERRNEFNRNPAFGLACATVPCAFVAMVPNDHPIPAMQLPWEPEWTPEIHADSVTAQEYLGVVEIENELQSGEMHVVSIQTPHGAFLVAGGACNTGLIPSFAREFDSDYETKDEALQELVSDIEAIPYPSGELRTWRGSMVI